MYNFKSQTNRLSKRTGTWKIAYVAAFAALLVLAPGSISRVPSVKAAGSVTFTQANLVSDIPGMAKITDPNLVNPWGMTLGLNSGLWVSDNGAG
jgi:hypothetical protein